MCHIKKSFQRVEFAEKRMRGGGGGGLQWTHPYISFVEFFCNSQQRKNFLIESIKSKLTFILDD